jgi:hypothetical protein
LRQRTEGMLWTALENVLEDRGLNPRIANALYDAFFNRTVTTAYYRDLIQASPATARNDLQAAAAGGLVKPVGETRGRRYEPGPHLMSAVSHVVGHDVEPQQRAILDALLDRANSANDLLPSPDAPTQQPLPGIIG